MPALLAQAPGDGEAVHVGQHHVEHDEVGLVSPASLRASAPSGGGVHLEAGEAQGGRQQLADVRLVVDDEEPCLGGLGGHGSSLTGEPVSWLDVGWDDSVVRALEVVACRVISPSR